MPDPSRTQLTLFVPASAAAEIEALRRVLDPVDFAMYAAGALLAAAIDRLALHAPASTPPLV